MGYWVIHEQNAEMMIFADNFGTEAGGEKVQSGKQGREHML